MKTTSNQPFPKDHIKVVLLEGIHQSAIDAFASESYQVQALPGSLSGNELIDVVRHAHIIGVR